MKATVWLWPIVTLICISQFVCTSAQQEYNNPEYPSDTNLMQDDYLLEKRTKPSLSIVNPLDVLRQRLLLEIARRQMKENTRQVEINRAILKNVGKRGQQHHIHQLQQQNLLDQQKEQEQQQQQQQQQQQSLHHSQLQLQQLPSAQHILAALRPNSFFEFLRHEELKNPKNYYNNNLSPAAVAAAAASASPSSPALSSVITGGSSDNTGINEIDTDGIIGDDNDDYQLRYLYRLHKNRYLNNM